MRTNAYAATACDFPHLVSCVLAACKRRGGRCVSGLLGVWIPLRRETAQGSGAVGMSRRMLRPGQEEIFDLVGISYTRT